MNPDHEARAHVEGRRRPAPGAENDNRRAFAVTRHNGGIAVAVTDLLSYEEALALAERLDMLAGAEDAEDVEPDEWAGSKGDREASRADWEYQARKEEVAA